MSIQISIKERLQEQFTNAKIPGTADIAIRNGYYYIKDVNHKEFKGKGIRAIATTLWKPSERAPFIKDLEFTVSLFPLNLQESIDYMNLTNKVDIPLMLPPLRQSKVTPLS